MFEFENLISSYLYLFNKLHDNSWRCAPAIIAIHVFRADLHNASTRDKRGFARGVYGCLQDLQKCFDGLTQHHIFPPLRECCPNTLE